jgi:hypothetical protein
MCQYINMLMLVLFHFQEYLEDGIDWTPMEFVDNTNCLSLFEKVCSSFFMQPCYMWIFIYSLFLCSLNSF